MDAGLLLAFQLALSLFFGLILEPMRASSLGLWLGAMAYGYLKERLAPGSVRNPEMSLFGLALKAAGVALILFLITGIALVLTTPNFSEEWNTLLRERNMSSSQAVSGMVVGLVLCALFLSAWLGFLSWLGLYSAHRGLRISGPRS